MKWAIAAAVTVATVAASVSIANAYTIDPNTNSRNAINIISNSGGHFELAENDAIKQARSFKLNVDISGFAAAVGPEPAHATLEYGSYDSEGNEKKLGELVKNTAYSGDLTGTLSAADVASGQFWLRAADDAYTTVTFHSISFFNASGNCILYGSADSGESNRKWTFYQLNSPSISVSGNANPDGSYVNSAAVSATAPIFCLVVNVSDDNSDDNACEWNGKISTVLVKGSETLKTDNITFTEDGNNEYEYSAYSTVTLTDKMNGNKTVKLYSLPVEKTVTLTDKFVVNNLDEPVVWNDSALTTASLEGRTAEDILSAANAMTGVPNVTEGLRLGIDGLPDCRIAEIVDRDAAGAAVRTFYVPVTYTAVQDFEPAVRAEQTVTLVGKADVSKLNVPTGYDNTVTVPNVKVASDYLTGVTLTAPTKTSYTLGETLDLTGGKLTLSYEHSADAEIPLTDSKVDVTGDLSTPGPKTVTVTYRPAEGEAKQDADLTETFEVVVLEKAVAPEISPNGGTFSSSQKVTITCATEGASIYYTTDGSDPTASSTKYTEPFTISVTTTVKAIAVKDGMADSEAVSATFTKKSSGGSSRPTTPSTLTETNPSIGGSAKSWSDVAADLAKLTNGSEVTIELNGCTTVPVEVIKVIDERDLKVTFVVDSVKSWKTDGAKITAPAAADLTFITTASTKSDGLRGTEGTQFKINDTGIPTSIEIAFKAEHAGKFANLYKDVSGKLVFVTCAKLGEDGKVILPDVAEKGNYVAMLCEFSDRPGDMDNDGIMSQQDAAAILKNFIEVEKGKNPLMADFNGDGTMNAMDASAILKRIVGLA